MPVTGDNLQNNKEEPLGDNSAQQAFSTPKGEGPNAGVSGTQNKKPRAEDPRTQSIKTAAERCPKSCNNIKWWHKGPEGILCHNKKVYVRGVEDACAEVLKWLHNDLLARHFGFKRTLELIRRYYFWPGMAKKVQQYITTCSMCRRIKPVCHKKYGKMQLLPMPNELYSD